MAAIPGRVWGFLCRRWSALGLRWQLVFLNVIVIAVTVVLIIVLMHNIAQQQFMVIMHAARPRVSGPTTLRSRRKSTRPSQWLPSSRSRSASRR